MRVAIGRLVLVLNLIGLGDRASFLNQTRNELKQKQCTLITLDIQLKISLVRT